MIVRTVLDLRPEVPKFILQTMLLAASWSRYSAKSAPLEIFVIGQAPKLFCDFLFRLGATTKTVLPNANDGFSKTSNTIQGQKTYPAIKFCCLIMMWFSTTISPC